MHACENSSLGYEYPYRVFCKRYHIARSKFIRVLVGTTAKDFYPCAQRESAKFIVHFHGHFTPLHGLEYVIEAAHILHEHRDVHFQIIGGGLGERAIKDRVAYLDLHNIEFMNSAPFDVLNKYINKASVCLGIFGDTTKARMVIPNKVFEALACGKPVITQNSDAIAELLVDQESVLLCEGGNAQDLAEKILLLKEKQTLQKKIAANGYHIFMQKLQPHMIVGDIIG